MEVANNTQYGQDVFSPLLSFAAFDIFLIVNFFLLTLPVCLFGIFTNIANIIVFCKMGFSESSNVNFLVLAVFDLFLLLFSLTGRGSYSPLLRTLSIGPQLLYTAHCAGPGEVVMTSGSAMMTTLIATERCVCVVFPLKVKTLLSRKRSLYLMLTVVTYHVAFFILIYSDPGPPYDSHPPKMLLYYLCIYIIPSTTCYFIVIFTTTALIYKLRKNQLWRQQTASQTSKSSDKEDKLVKTIIAICMLFIICSFPNVVVFIAQVIYPPFNYNNPFLSTLVMAFFDISFDFQVISSSFNMLFYYTISSKYKKDFLTLFWRRSENSGVD